MTVECKFVGGPLDGRVGNVAALMQCQIFFDTHNRLVSCYNRIDELVYVYEAEVSKGLTNQYDEAFIRFGADTASGRNAVESFKDDLTGSD